MILNKNLDFGVAFDGDADRVVFLDSKAREISGDKCLFLSSKLLKKADKFVTTIMTNNAIEESLLKKGIKLLKLMLVIEMFTNQC